MKNNNESLQLNTKIMRTKKWKFDSDWCSVFKKLAAEFITLFEFENKIKDKITI